MEYVSLLPKNLLHLHCRKLLLLPLLLAIVALFTAAPAGAQSPASNKPATPSTAKRNAQSAQPAQRARRTTKAPATVAKDVAPAAPTVPVKSVTPITPVAAATPITAIDSGKQEADETSTAVSATDADRVNAVNPASVPTESVDSIEVLRAEAETAKTDAERGRLELKIVDALIAKSNPPDALNELRRMTGATHFDPAHFYNVANRLARLGDTGAAVAAYRKAIDQRRGFYPRAFNNLGVALISLGDLDAAEKSLTQALRQENFTYAEASYNLGRLYTIRGAEGDAELATRAYNRAVRYAPDHLEAAVALARIYAFGGDLKKALAVLDRVRAADETARRNLAEARRALLLSVEATTANVKSPNAPN